MNTQVSQEEASKAKQDEHVDHDAVSAYHMQESIWDVTFFLFIHKSKFSCTFAGIVTIL